MNGRVIAKRSLACVLVVIALFSLAVDGEPWAKGVLFAVCTLGAILLFRRTPKDDEWMRRQEDGELVGQVVADAMRDDGGGGKEPGSGAKRVAVGLTALHVLAAPFIILKDVLKMQK